MPDEQLAFTVLGMSCGHCKATIERALHDLGNIHQVNVDLAERTVTVHGEGLDEERLRRKIDDAGYVVRSSEQAR
jgi:copper chaperone